MDRDKELAYIMKEQFIGKPITEELIDEINTVLSKFFDKHALGSLLFRIDKFKCNEDTNITSFELIGVREIDKLVLEALNSRIEKVL